jgi:hypothetical protein
MRVFLTLWQAIYGLGPELRQAGFGLSRSVVCLAAKLLLSINTSKNSPI